MSTSNDVSGRAVRWVFFIALVARLAVIYSGSGDEIGRSMADDSQRYVTLADALVQHATFGKADEEGEMHLAVERVRTANGTLPEKYSNGLRPEGFRTPGYPVYLAVFRLFTDDLRRPLFFQCLLGALAAGSIVRLAHRYGANPRAAVLAGLVWALHPALLLYDNVVLTESLFTTMLVFALWLVRKKGTAGTLVTAAVICGLAGLVRPLGLLFLPAVIASWWSLSAIPRRRLVVAIAVLAAALPSAAWATRNAAVGYGFRVTTVGDLNWLFYTASYTVAEQEGKDWFQQWPKTIPVWEQKLTERVKPGEDVVSAARSLAFEELGRRPKVVAKVHAKSWLKLTIDHSCPDLAKLFGRTYAPTGVFSGLLAGEGLDTSRLTFSAGFALAWTGTNAALAGLAFIGFVRFVRRRSLAGIVLTTITVPLFFIATGAVGLERFRLPLMPVIAVAAAVGVSRRRPTTNPPSDTDMTLTHLVSGPRAEFTRAAFPAAHEHRPTTDDADKLSVLVPVYNEEKTIAEILTRVLALGPVVKEIILVDDGSKDRTAEVIRAYLGEGHPKIRFHKLPYNQGKTAAIKKALELATGEIIIIQDADLEYDPAEIPDVIGPILAGQADVVYGSRFLVRKAARVLYFYHYLANCFLTFLSNMLTNRNMSDIETCYKAFRAEVIKPMNLTSKGFGMEVEITALICKTKARTYEVPISYYGRAYEEGKKIGMMDGVAALWYIGYYNLIKPWFGAVRRYKRAVNEGLGKREAAKQAG